MIFLNIKQSSNSVQENVDAGYTVHIPRKFFLITVIMMHKIFRTNAFYICYNNKKMKIKPSTDYNCTEFLNILLRSKKFEKNNQESSEGYTYCTD